MILEFFQFGGRFENIEYLLNNIIGPRSYLRTTKAEQIADDLSASVRSFINQMTEKTPAEMPTESRSKRSISKKAREKVEAAPKVYNIDFSRNRSTRSVLIKYTYQL